MKYTLASHADGQPGVALGAVATADLSHAAQSPTTGGGGGFGGSVTPRISGDGRYVAYASLARDLISGGGDPGFNNGSLAAFASIAGNGTVHVVLDVNGYFE
jgi:hypothetical protein